MTREEIVNAVRTGVRCENLLQPSKNNMFCCPFCGSGTGRNGTGAVKVYNDNKWYCNKCKEHGDSIDLLQHINKTDFEGAITIGFKMLGSPVNFAPVPAKKTSDKKINNQDFRKYYAECAGRLSDEEAVAYLKSRGISYETARRLFVGYDPQSDPAFAPGGEGEMRYPRKRIIIPTTASHYVGRSIDADQSHNKVNNKGGSPGIFNSKALKDNEGVVFVVEGAFDALSIEEIGQPAVALNSTANVKKLLTALKKEKPSAILAVCMDNDNAGENATDNLKAGLDALKVPYIKASISGKYKDANEALVADPEGFRHDVEQAVSMAKSVSLDVHEAVEPAVATEASADALPGWITESTYNGRTTRKLNEPLFCDLFKAENKIFRINGVFYLNGKQVSDELVLSMIQNRLQPYFTERTGRKTNDVFLTLQNSSFIQQPKPDERKIYCADDLTITVDDNGELSFKKEDVFTLTRLAVKYNPGADCPTFTKYLSDLLYEEDIPVVQEFMGYCLVPSTRAQAGLFIHGQGGEGKSILRDVIVQLFGYGSIQEGIHKLSERFVLANLENKLVCVDDDMKTDLLSDTATIKKLITNTPSSPIQVERKNRQKYDAFIYARIFAIGNSFIGSKFDHSDGFYRRQLLIDCKPKTRSEEDDDRFMREKVCKEIEGIFAWCIVGLIRLIKNGYRFSVSDRMKRTLDDVKHEGDNSLTFFEDDSVVSITSCFADEITSVDLFTAYALWCFDNGETPVKRRSFLNRAGERFKIYKIRMQTSEGRLQGFSHIRLSGLMSDRLKVLDEKTEDRIKRLP